MASEIEVGEEVELRDRKSSSAAAGVGQEDDTLKNDVYSVAAHGELEKLQRLVECEGCSVSEPDRFGHYALQWAAVNNHTAAAQYIMEHGGDVNATDHNGQTALHWSAVRGAIQVAELLLKEGARVNGADLCGYQAAHIAAQYGQTAFLYHIVKKWNADPDVPDDDGRSPLHWAAYKGFADCIRLLLFLDAYRGRQDKEGCTPLHWAAIRGNLEACMVLVQASKKQDLVVTDKTGLTPAQLASHKNHRQVAFFLGNARRLLDANNHLGRLSRLGLAPVLWVMIVLLLIAYIHAVIMASNLPRLTAGLALSAWLGVLLAIAGLVLFHRCSSKDPGFIKMSVHDPQNVKDNEPLLKIEINNPALLDGNWSQLCTTCKILRPLRAKHCSTCDRCVEQFDHHCPWVSNCIGKRNKWDFFLFLVLEASAMLITGAVALTRVLTDPLSPSSFTAWLNHAVNQHIGAVTFLIVDFFLFFSVATLTSLQASQISRNITTNEMVNAMRYSYLRGPGGGFRNPYDHGCKKNCSDFLIKGYNEDIDCAEESELECEGIGMVDLARNSNLQINDNRHTVRSVNNPTTTHQGHVHSSQRCHNHHKEGNGEPVRLGLGLGLGSVVTSS